MYPPDDLKEVSDVIVNESVEERISRFEKGDYAPCPACRMKCEKKSSKKFVLPYHHARPSLRDQPRHEVYQVALWKSDRLLAP